MSTNRWGLVAALTLIPVCAAAGVEGDDAQVHVVKADTMNVQVRAWGILEPSSSYDVFCKVEGPATVIISLVPEGSRVTKGQLVCELDSSTIKDRLTNQEIATKSAEAAYQNAKLTREVAEIALIQYKEGVLRQDRQTLAGEAALRQADIPRAEAWLERIRSALKQVRALSDANGGSARTAADLVAEIDLEERLRVALKDLGEAQAAIGQVQTRKTMLEQYTAPKTINQLTGAIQTSRSDELAKEQTWMLEKTKEARLRKQIVNCKLFAPADGQVVYANDTNRFNPDQQPQIEEGATVRERQKVFSIPDTSAVLRVNVKVPETVVGWVRVGLRARIKVEGFEDDPLLGTVVRIQGLPDVMPYISLDKVRTYSTFIQLEKSRPGVALGMTAEVEIVNEPLKDVLTVPLPSVVYYDGADHVVVKKGSGGWEWRGVSLGLSDGTQAEVKDGLKVGEAVAIDPGPLLTGGQKLRMSLSPPRPAPRPRPVSLKRNLGGGLLHNPVVKLRAMPAADRAKVLGGSPEERAAILKKAGFTDGEIQTLNQSLPAGGTPR